MNFRLYSIFALLFLNLIHLTKAQIPEEPHNYVTDAANVLSDEEEAILNDTLQKFEKKTSNQIFVLIAQSTEGRDFIELTLEVASKWKVGQKDKDNGVLIAIYLDDHKMRIEVGYGLEGAIPDMIANRIRINDINPHLKDGEYFEAVRSGVFALMDASKGEYKGISEEEEILQNQRGFMYISSSIVGFFSLVTFFVHRRRYLKWKKEAEENFHKARLKKKENEKEKQKEPEDKTKNYYKKWIHAAIVYGIFFSSVFCYFLKIGGIVAFFIPMIGIFILFAFFVLDMISFWAGGLFKGGITFGSGGTSSSGRSWGSSSGGGSSFSGGGGGRFGGGGSGGSW